MDSSHPCVTAKSWAACRDVNVRSNRKTRQYVPFPPARLIAKAALKRPHSVACVVGETTYSPMEMALFRILFDQLAGQGAA